jgi:two-component system, OmpR family, phosphate regulon sensor histidine kinase PhoR
LRLGVRVQIFLLSLGLIAVTVVAAHAYLSAELDGWLTDRIRRDQRVRLQLVEHEVSEATFAPDDVSGWDRLADDLGRRASARVTIIRRDGVVLGDSDVAAAELAYLENHAGRPEVVAAYRDGYGESTRLSTTVGKRMMYQAVPFRRGGAVVGAARVALPLTDVDAAIARLSHLITLASVLALALAVAMSVVAAQLATRGVRALTGVARRMAAGDLGARSRTSGRGEIAELGGTLDRLAQGLERSLTDLRGERDLMSGVLDGMQEGVLLLGSGGRIDLVNPALREMLLLETDAVGRTLLEAIRHAELKELLDRAAQGTTTGEIEIAGLRPRRLLVQAAPLRGGAGGLLAVFVDVTDMRRLESLRRDFVANVSHELRTPIAAVRSAAETLRSGAMAGPDGPHFLGVVERNAERLERLVEDLLDLARIESREYKLTLEAVDLGPVFAQVLEANRARADARRVGLRASIATGLGPVRADRRALEQVLSNLVDNAVKYTHEDTVVMVAAEADGPAIRIAVRDAGPGIEARHLPRLFERFYRVDAGRSREQGGTGLGLSIVKHLCEAMGGTVGVESRVGLGTAFFAVLPRA